MLVGCPEIGCGLVCVAVHRAVCASQDVSNMVLLGGTIVTSSLLSTIAPSNGDSSSAYVITETYYHNFSSGSCNAVCLGVTITLGCVAAIGFIAFWLWRKRTGKDRKDERVMKMKRVTKLGVNDGHRQHHHTHRQHRRSPSKELLADMEAGHSDDGDGRV